MTETNTTTVKIKPMKYQKRMHPPELLYNDIYEGMHYYIVSMGTHPCAYIEIPLNNQLIKMLELLAFEYLAGNEITYRENYLRISEGTIIDSTGYDLFIGWDHAHSTDYVGFMESELSSLFDYSDLHKWTTEEMIEECKQAIDELLGIWRLDV